MFPNNFDEWLSVNNVVNKNKSFEEQLKECWNSARDNLLKENKDLELEKTIEELKQVKLDNRPRSSKNGIIVKGIDNCLLL